ncbi:MAG: aspartate--tRNA(Asn) ligase [Thermoprotei archaeon]
MTFEVKRTHLASEITPAVDGSEVTLLGWLHEKRDLGGLRFLLLRDRSGLVQTVAAKKEISPQLWEEISNIKRESVLVVKGIAKASPQAPGGAEVRIREVKLISPSEDPPIDVVGKTSADLDTRLDNRIIDLRRAEPQAIFKIQSTVSSTIRSYLREKGFVEVFTPKIIATATEGGASLFSVFYYDRIAYLSQSPQLYKEQLTSAFERVFEIAPAFRAEESDTQRHLSEITMVDAEAAFMDYQDVMSLLDGLMERVVKSVNEENRKELKVLGREVLDLKVPIPRVTYDEAVGILDKKGVEHEKDADFGTVQLKALSEELTGFYFITDWPTAARPFYAKPIVGRPDRCESFDLMYGWIELASGATRINDAKLLRDRMSSQGLNPDSFKTHLKWFGYGMPPHAGFGLGLARLLMVLTGKDNIREVVMFPRDRRRLEP